MSVRQVDDCRGTGPRADAKPGADQEVQEEGHPQPALSPYTLRLTVLFEHPLTRKRAQRMIYDISTSGFSVDEPADEGVLIPGMVIPDMTITYAAHAEIEVQGPGHVPQA